MANRLINVAWGPVNIAAAASVYAYTATVPTFLQFQVYISDCAGGGDYIAHITKQRAGAGAAYVMLPKTTATAAAGETAIAFETILTAVYTGDVINVMVDGLAGDIACNGFIEIIEHDYIHLDATQGGVAFAGQVSITANVAAQGALHITNSNAAGYGQRNQGAIGMLNRGTVSSGLENDGKTYGHLNRGDLIGLYMNGTAVGMRIAGDTSALQIAGLIGNAIDISGAMDGIDVTGANGHGVDISGSQDGIEITGAAGNGIQAIGSIDGIQAIGTAGNGISATGVAGNGIEATGAVDGMTLTGTAGYGLQAAGGTNETDIGLCDVWLCTPRTLTSSGTVTVVSVVNGDKITVRPYSTWVINVNDVGSLVGRTSLWFGVKDDPAIQADASSFLQVEETAGLQYINGAAGVGANATLVVTDPVAGDFTVTVNKSQTGVPPCDGRIWQLKVGIAGGADTVIAEGEFNVGQTVTRTTA